jgi:hypothetical protein
MLHFISQLDDRLKRANSGVGLTRANHDRMYGALAPKCQPRMKGAHHVFMSGNAFTFAGSHDYEHFFTI